MIHQQIKELFFSSVEHIVSDISQYAVHPDSDFKRSKKIPAQKLISFLISQGSSSTRVEMLHALRFGARVVVAVTFQQVDDTPDTKTSAQSDNESLKNGNCLFKKCHIVC